MIGDYVFIYNNTTIMPVLKCNNMVICADTVVTNNIIQLGIYAANLLRKLRTLP